MTEPSVVVASLLGLEEAQVALAQALDQTAWDGRMRARKTASFGLPYDYSGMTYPPAPWPGWLLGLRTRLEAATGCRFTNCLANLYPTGASTMGFHFDSFANLQAGSVVAVVSLGSPRTLRFRLQRERSRWVDHRLHSGALLTMGKQVQDDWHHAVLEEPGTGPRVSLTFRHILPTSTTSAQAQVSSAEPGVRI